MTLILFPVLSALAQEHGGHGHGAPVIMENMTVTAEKIEEYAKNHPQQVTVVDRKEIQERNFLSVEETLNSMPGVEVRPSAGIGTRISIRGSGKSGGVLVLLNGRPLNSSQYGGADLSTIPIDIVKSVTVFKPPVPVWLGPGAADGAISIVTHDFQPDTEEKAKKGKTGIKVSAGSFGLAEGSLNHTQPLESGSVMLTAAGTRSDGRRSNSDRDNGIFSLHWDHKTETALQYDVNGRYYISEYGSAGPTDNPTPDARQRYAKASADFQLRGFAGESGDYSLKAYADQVDLTDESQSGFTSDLTDTKFGIKADSTWSEESGIWALRAGGILERDDADHTVTGDHHRVSGGLHAQVDRHFGTVTATLGLRGDHSSDFDFNPGCSGGLSYALTEHLLIKGNAGYTVNVPTFGQLYQPAHGSYDQVRGNPDLDEEKIWSYDLGAEYRFRKDRMLQATLFRTDTDDPIVYLRRDDLIYQPVNADKAWRHGIELSLKYAWDAGLSADFSYILQDSENRETGKELSYTPRHKFSTTLKYVLPRFDTRLETCLRYEAERYSEAEAQESQKLDDYITADLKAVQPFTVKEIPLEFFINICNLFDADFEFHHGYPDDGIRFVTGLNMTF
ncbi:MAG: TonB-dependent receptor [Desulfobacterales bacterium]